MGDPSDSLTSPDPSTKISKKSKKDKRRDSQVITNSANSDPVTDEAKSKTKVKKNQMLEDITAATQRANTTTIIDEVGSAGFDASKEDRDIGSSVDLATKKRKHDQITDNPSFHAETKKEKKKRKMPVEEEEETVSVAERKSVPGNASNDIDDAENPRKRKRDALDPSQKTKKKKDKGSLSEATKGGTDDKLEKEIVKIVRFSDEAKNVRVKKKKEKKNEATGGDGKSEGKKSKKRGDLEDEETGKDEKKKKSKSKAKKTSSEHPDLPRPDEDSTLSDKARNALSYSYSRLTCPDSWKFNKALQNWIVKHLWSDQAIPEAYTVLVAGYLADCKGGVRDKLIESCQKVLSSDDQSEKKDEASADVVTTRARILLKVFDI